MLHPQSSTLYIYYINLWLHPICEIKILLSFFLHLVYLKRFLLIKGKNSSVLGDQKILWEVVNFQVGRKK